MKLKDVGLRRGTVQIVDYQESWKTTAMDIINELKEVFGPLAVDIQHIGSTAIQGIKAKPIIDIAIGVRSFDELSGALLNLEKLGFQKNYNRFSSDLLYVLQDEQRIRAVQVHILIYDCKQWHNYVDFRDYMNSHREEARKYEALKLNLVENCHDVQMVYTDGKKSYMDKLLPIAREWAKSCRDSFAERPLGT